MSKNTQTIPAVTTTTYTCDRCGKTSGDLATDQKDLPTPDEMRRRGWFIAETWGDRCPECVEAERAEVLS